MYNKIIRAIFNKRNHIDFCFSTFINDDSLCILVHKECKKIKEVVSCLN